MRSERRWVMSAKKPPAEKRPKQPPAYDVDFRSRFGVNVSPDVAEVFRCKVCGGYIYPLRRLLWSCETMLCGPVIPDSELRYRLSCVLRPDEGQCIVDVMRFVRDNKPE